jgi:MoaA/NifB/PqqE/SkfB family radical SAM enzyme
VGSARGLLHTIRDAGVVYLQLTGGEPLIDRLFCETYELAWRLGIMLHVSTNGSRPPANTVPYTAAALAAITGGASSSLDGW